MAEVSEVIVDDGTEGAVAPEDRITMPRLSKFEKARVVGVRKQMIATGSSVLVSIEGLKDLDAIVNEELKQGKIPFKIKRPLPNGKFELWSLSELTIST